MNQRKPSGNMELIISTVLQGGVIVSSLMVVLGIVLFFARTNLHDTSYHHFTSTTYSFPHSVPVLKASLQSGAGVGFIELGVLLLILTPILRVATSTLLFTRQHDKPMTFVTLFVLLALVSSFIVGTTLH